jgi:hypothetical protein
MTDPALIISKAEAESYNPAQAIIWPHDTNLVLNVDGCVVVRTTDGKFIVADHLGRWVPCGPQFRMIERELIIASECSKETT